MTILTFNGWGQPADGLAHLLPNAKPIFYSEYRSIKDILQLLAEHEEVEGAIGWSLGGQLAVRIVLAGVIRPRWLALIAAPYQHVAKPDLALGMAPEFAETFRDSYLTHTAKTVSKFNGLIVKGDRRARELLPAIRDNPTAHDTERWLPWLDDLSAYSSHGQDHAKLPPVLILQGTEDAIVRPDQAKAWQRAIPHARVEWFEGAGHAPHWHDEARVKRLLEEFRKA